ncbi:DMP19 family protein [Vannielia litorea]|uniref:DMP19 family protein n=1 Tax=Vannielia litorea TaxID=1217970 RepID=UPI001BCC9494|nr:hypothetical protein [Vannielia litorea]MBS8225859.1 hypothetical protein [Vannielia litorea]
MNQSTPRLGLHSRIGTGDITHGQWALYTETCLVGQIVNGGVEQFIENCPGLISDAEKLLAAYGPPALHDAYVKAAAPFLAVIADHAARQSDATGDALAPFHADFEAAWDVVDESLFGPIEASCYAKARDADPENGFTALEDRLLRWVLAYPEEFRQTG